MLELSIITDEILMGTQIRNDADLRLLRSLGVGGILALQEDADWTAAGVVADAVSAAAAACGMEHRCCAVRDFDATEMVRLLPSCVAELTSLVKANKRVYVHCTAGVNRSSSVVLAFLVWKRKYSVDQALRIVRSRRPQASPYSAVVSLLGQRR